MMDSWYTEDAHGDPEITSKEGEREREYDCSIEFDLRYLLGFLRFLLASVERDEYKIQLQLMIACKNESILYICIQIYLFYKIKNGTKSVIYFFESNNIIFKVDRYFCTKEKKKKKERKEI